MYSNLRSYLGIVRKNGTSVYTTASKTGHPSSFPRVQLPEHLFSYVTSTELASSRISDHSSNVLRCFDLEQRGGDGLYYGKLCCRPDTSRHTDNYM